MGRVILWLTAVCSVSCISLVVVAAFGRGYFKSIHHLIIPFLEIPFIVVEPSLCIYVFFSLVVPILLRHVVPVSPQTLRSRADKVGRRHADLDPGLYSNFSMDRKGDSPLTYLSIYCLP